MNKNANFFISRQDSMDFPNLLDKVQAYMSENYKELLTETGEDNKAMLISRIRSYLSENRVTVPKMTDEELISRLYMEMHEYSFLTPYLNFEILGIEGIEINPWNNVMVKHSDGRLERIKEHFFSAEHARSIIGRLLERSNIKMDYTQPLARGYLGKNIRITVIGGWGTLDSDFGIAVSIRFVNPSNLTRDDLIRFGTLTPEMMDFLVYSYRYKISMMLAGETDAGKTTLMSIIMRHAVPDDKKLYTIENGTREFNLIKYNEIGEIINNVVHTVTRESLDEKLRITQQMLIEQGMTMNPDYLCLAEVKGSEAFETMEAALTGHPVIGTTHTDCAETIPDRLMQLASLKSSTISDRTLYYMVTKAFPILFYSEKMADGVRRVTQICECQLENDRPKVTPLWKYVTQANEIVNGNTIIHGYFKKCGVISSDLQNRLRRNGMPEDILQSFLSKEGSL